MHINKDKRDKSPITIGIAGGYSFEKEEILTANDQLALLSSASRARLAAYAPYSNYLVGAALLVNGGEIFNGCNIENRSYPHCICAERVAISKAISEGHREFLAMLVVTENGGTPCGLCRQVMNEFAPDMPVYIANTTDIISIYKVHDLLP